MARKWWLAGGLALAALLLALGVFVLPMALSGPSVVAVVPADGAEAVVPQDGIRITFDQWVREETVLAAVRIEPAVELRAERDGKVVVLRPVERLQYGRRYRLTIGRGIRNVLGRAGESEQHLAFTTLEAVAVLRATPAEEGAQVSLDAPITVEFDAPVVPAEMIAAVAEDPALGEKLPQPLVLEPAAGGIGRWLSPTLYGFYPEQGLRAATTYKATVSTTLRADLRAQLKAPFSWSFTTEAPLLLGSWPYDGADDVPSSATVEVQLAQDVDRASAAERFSLYEADSGKAVTGEVSSSGAGLVFKPAVALTRGARYEARLAAGVRSPSGAQLNERPLTWSFTTMGDLAVEQVEPLPDSTDVPTATRRISVRFNHPVVALTTIAEQAGLPQPLTITPALQGEGRWLDTSTYVYELAAPLPPATSYRVEVASALRDQDGGVLRAPFSWTFGSVRPLVLGSSPMDGAAQASPIAPIELFFNVPMDLASLRQHVTLTQAGAEVAGSVSLSGTVVLFTPDAPLRRGAGYTLRVEDDARSASGDMPLQSSYQANFAVAPAPALISSTPSNGDRAVVSGYGIELAFSTPMDWASLKQHLAIAPKPAALDHYAYDNVVSLQISLQPETDYRVTVGGQAQDSFGTPLGKDEVITFRTLPLRPSATIMGPSPAGTYSAYADVRVPLSHVNLDGVLYDLYALDMRTAGGLLVDWERWNSFTTALDAGELKPSRSGSQTLSGKRNRTALTYLELGRLDPGAYFLRISGPTIGADTRMLVVSPYAVTLKRSDEELFIWAVDLNTGEPVRELPFKAISASREPAPLGHTDGDGVLQAAYKSAELYDQIAVWSEADDGFSFAATGWGEGISPWDFGLSSAMGHAPFVGNITSDRPLYRPAQTIHLRGALRATKGEGYALPPPGTQARVRVEGPDGTEIFNQLAPLTSYGTFSVTLALDSSAQIGRYGVIAAIELPSAMAVDPNVNPGAIYGSFAVAEYRKPAFEVTAEPARADLVQGETLELAVAASYFAGGGVAHAPVRWRLMGEPLYFESDLAPGFSFEDLDDPYAYYRWYDDWWGGSRGGPELISEGTARTDAQGRLTLRLPVDLGTQMQSRKLTFDLEVTDVDGRVVAGHGTANVHAGAFHIGLRPEGYVFKAGDEIPVSLIAVGLDGKPVPSQALTVGIYEREWFSAQEEGADGQLYWTSHFTDTLVQELPATTDANGRGTLKFTVKQGGSYRIGAQGRDADGHTVKASAYTWVYGSDVFWGMDNTSRITLIADKDRYRPGETAKILIPAPYKGMRALLTIERGTVLEHRLLTLDDTTELVELPIDGSHAPNIFFSVVLIKPGAPGSAPDIRAGLLNLRVSTEQQQLTISVTPDREQAGPREQVTYTIATTDHAGVGVPAEVSLALVDKALLSLADDANPTLHDSFYERRPLGVHTSQSLTIMVDRLKLDVQPGSKGGGGGEAAALQLRRDMPDTAYWNPALVTGPDGRATVTVTLPDSLTTWRMTARGLTADTRVGQASQDLLTTRPLMIRPSLPRFLTIGDKAVLVAVVHNQTGQAIDASVTIEPGLLKLGAPAEQQVAVAADGTAVVRWPVEVPVAGETRVRLFVSGGGLEDAVEQPLPIQRFTTPEVVASVGQVGTRPVVETLRLPADLPAAPDGSTEGEVALELAPSLAAGIEGGLSYLEDYPYDCVEQTVSSFLPNAVTYRLYKELGVERPELRKLLEENLASGLQRLYSLQQSDGGWSWWESGESIPYLSAYVVQGLVEAQRAGYAVDARVLERGLAYLKQALVTVPASDSRDAWSDDTRSFVLFVLAEAGQPDRGRTIKLYEERHRLGVQGQAYLLMTLDALGQEQTRIRTVVAELMSAALLHTADAHWEERERDPWTMSSDTRSTALALQALVRVDPENFLVPNAVRYLMGLRSHGHWETTQETAVTLMALAEYIADSGELKADYSYRASLDGDTLKEGRVDHENLDDPVEIMIDLAALKSGARKLTLERQAADGQSGSGRLYYTLRMRYYQHAEQVEPLTRGLAITREYIGVDQATISPTGQLLTGAALGEIVQVRLTIDVPENVHYVALEDMLPAGLEALDTSLKNVTTAAEEARLAPADGKHPYWWYFEQTQIHDDHVALFATYLPKGTYHYTYLARATTAGSFQTLPARVYEMYTPEVFGRSAGARFEVREP